MKILFCKISAMKYYKGACKQDQPYNGGKFVDENGFGHEEFNFLPIETDDGSFCFGFVETKHTSKTVRKSNQLRIEKIKGCELLTKEESVDNVLVVWCATTDLNETSVVGWYKNAIVYRNYQPINITFADGSCEDRGFNVSAKVEDCVLLPQSERHRHIWNAPAARKKGYGFGQSLVWYALEENATSYVENLIKSIDNYDDENWLYQPIPTDA